MTDDESGEEPLAGDGVTPGIVRIGDTVRRPVRPFTATIQAYLAHRNRPFLMAVTLIARAGRCRALR